MDMDFRSIRWARRFGLYWDEFDGVKILRVSVPIGARFFVPMRLIKFISCYFGLKGFKQIKKKIDMIIAHFAFESGNAAEYINQKENIPYILFEHSSYFMSRGKSLEITKSVYQNASAVIAVSEFLSRQIEEFAAIKPLIIPNLIDEDVFFFKRTIHENFKIISVGRIVPWKQFDFIVEATNSLHKKGIHVKVDIVGTGSEEGKLKRLVQEYGIEDSVRFLGIVKNEDIPDLYCKSDLFVLPSKGETFGVVYLEALACGIPVVATNVGGAGEFIDDSNGLLIDCSSANNVEKAIISIHENYGKYNGRLISDAAIKKYGKKEFVKKLQSIINVVRKKHEIEN